MAIITMWEHKVKVAADMARLRAKVVKELPRAAKRQLEAVHDTGAKRYKLKRYRVDYNGRATVMRAKSIRTLEKRLGQKFMRDATIMLVR